MLVFICILKYNIFKYVNFAYHGGALSMTKVGDWVEKWKTDCGTVKEPDDTKLILSVGEEDIYIGHFLDVPESLWDREVYKNAQVLDSTDPNRCGSYVLYIEAEKKILHDEYLVGLYSTIEICDFVLQNEAVMTQEQIEKARKLKEETKINIAKRESIPFEQRI